MGDDTQDDKPDLSKATGDPGSLKDAHGRTGRLLKHAGLPFDAEELDETEGERASNSSEEE